MAWSISAEDYSSRLPGSTRITVIGDPSTDVEIYRIAASSGAPVKLRNTAGAATSASGLYRVLDTEAPFEQVSYELRIPSTGESFISNTVTVRQPPTGQALLRSILSPFGEVAAVTLADETNIDFRTSSTVFDVVSRIDPVVISDVRRERSGTYIFIADDMAAADYLLRMMRDGTPLLLRACPGPPRRVRDTYFYPLDVREERWGTGGRRLIIVDYQSVGEIAGDAPLPPGGGWTYGALALQGTAPEYGDLPTEWADYLDLATRRVP